MTPTKNPRCVENFVWKAWVRWATPPSFSQSTG
jgi:hypothetical protein